jgi:uncharacterized protein (TIGR00369 family)
MMQPTELAGLDFLRAMGRGDLPPAPMAQLMGMAPVEVEEGLAIFEATPRDDLYNPLGSVHGGFAATLLDTAMGCAVHTALPAGSTYVTLELSVNFVRAITVETGRVRAEGRTLHVGRRVATAEGRLIAEATGKLLAHGTTTCAVS